MKIDVISYYKLKEYMLLELIFIYQCLHYVQLEDRLITVDIYYLLNCLLILHFMTELKFNLFSYSN